MTRSENRAGRQRRYRRLSALALAFSVMTVVGQQDTGTVPMPPAPPDAGAPAAAPAPAPAEEQPAEPAEQLLQLKFQAAPVDQVLDFYAGLTGRTVLQAPNIAGNITLKSQTRLNRDEVMQAIESVLAMNNVGIFKVGDKFLKVVPVGEVGIHGMNIRMIGADKEKLVETDALVSQLLRLKYIELAEAQKAIEGLKHPFGKIQALERINSLLVTDTAANINRILEIIEQIDQPIESKQELKIVQVFHAKASDIKKKVDEILLEALGEKEKEKPTTARPKQAGSPGFEAPRPILPPGVIRAPRGAELPAAAAEAAAEEIAEAIERGLVQGRVSIVADDRTNILLIMTRKENIPFLEKIVTALDVETKPDVAVKIIRLDFADADSVGSMLNAFIGAKTAKADGTAPPAAGKPATPGEERKAETLRDFIAPQERGMSETLKSKIGELSAENIKILPDKRTNSLLIMASYADLATLEEIIREMDMMLSQVRIESVILEVNLDKALNTGMAWVQRSLLGYKETSGGGRSAKVAFAGRGGSGELVPLDASQFLDPSAIPAAAGLQYYFTHFGLTVDMIMKAVATDSRTRILSSPTILTTDNKEANIDVSTERYFTKGQKYVTTSGYAGEWVDDVEMRKVGINLTVTPRINERKVVVMDVKQKVENIAGDQIVNKTKWPIVASRQLGATVTVRSGETIVLGGLVMNRGVESRSKVPLLGDIPILGRAFSADDREQQRSEVIVFLTPYVLDTAEDIAMDAARRKESMHVTGMWEKGWSDSKLADSPEDQAKSGEPEPRLRKRAPDGYAPRKPAQSVGAPSPAPQEQRVPRPFAAQTNTAASLEGIDPKVIKFIQSQEKRWGRALDDIDKEIERELEPKAAAP